MNPWAKGLSTLEMLSLSWETLQCAVTAGGRTPPPFRQGCGCTIAKIVHMCTWATIVLAQGLPVFWVIATDTTAN